MTIGVVFVERESMGVHNIACEDHLVNPPLLEGVHTEFSVEGVAERLVDISYYTYS